MPLLNKIIVCDDEDPIAHLIQMALGDAGYLCLRARDGEQAVFLAGVEYPELLILDVMMPKLDGLQACKRLKADAQLARIPILMLTSLSATDDKVRGFEAGADDYLAKPFDLRELVARVKALIRASRRARDSSPSTGLPGAAALEERVEGLLRDKAPFVLTHAGLWGYQPFVDAHGWGRGESLVAAVGRALAHEAAAAAKQVGEQAPPLVTHLGGDDFGLVGSPAASARLVETLNGAVAEATAAFGEPAVRLVVTQVSGGAEDSVESLARALAKARKATASRSGA